MKKVHTSAASKVHHNLHSLLLIQAQVATYVSGGGWEKREEHSKPTYQLHMSTGNERISEAIKTSSEHAWRNHLHVQTNICQVEYLRSNPFILV